MENLLFLLMGAFLTSGGIWVKWYLSQYDRKNQFRQKSVERRLEAHQKAFSLTFEMMKGATPDKFENLFNKCQHWWNENNFYLEPRSRRVFHDCYWELLAFQSKTTNNQVVDRQLNFFRVVIPQTRKILTEEIGYSWWDENSPETDKNHSAP